MPFVKLDCGIINSTIWLDRPAREIFLTSLLMAEPYEVTDPIPQLSTVSLEPTGWEVPPGWYGFVHASGPGLIDRAKVSMEEGKPALVRLGEPEIESRSQEFEGRRLVRVNGGYVVLNFMKYRERDYSAAERSARYRRRKAEKLASRVADVASRVIITQAEAEVEVDPDLDLANYEDPVKKIGEREAGSRSSAAPLKTANGWIGNGKNPHGDPERLINGHEQRRHGQHAWCAPERPNLCVTNSQHQDMLGASQKPDEELKAWYAETVAKYNGQPVGDDRFVFWRNELAQWIGTVSSVPIHKKSHPSDPARERRLKAAAEYRANMKGAAR